MSENLLTTNNEVFTEEDFSSLPVVIQKYIQRLRIYWNTQNVLSENGIQTMLIFHRAKIALL
jgi:hypothetical protein